MRVILGFLLCLTLVLYVAPVGGRGVKSTKKFNYEDVRRAYANAVSTLGDAVANEIGMDTFLNDLSAYAEYDGTPLADLPNTDRITIRPDEHWALTYTDPQSPGVTTALFLPETRNFDPNVGLPDELPGYAIEAIRERYPLFYERYLSDLETNYANSRTDMEFDDTTYGPDADGAYPQRTDVGGGFALERIGTAHDRLAMTYPLEVGTGRSTNESYYIEAGIEYGAFTRLWVGQFHVQAERNGTLLFCTKLNVMSFNANLGDTKMYCMRGRTKEKCNFLRTYVYVSRS
ncbi:uncharacterized protein LOC118413342 isoform X2 [Branchiostoma floridae]|uniref:Uncharacterized protein LOC118413342 isoform X1 n=2 Tax=Branchiostoma floridae TaxID=7739 RepID=A0A9J7MLW1_BRAFL|nr:uncharacterized protein LOC118413342 isoform X1 [Branchiostoma floridae]XP_035672572.1 uncharacterized protein LOC118413342 isoform X2 [Branchiostoma floridae]